MTKAALVLLCGYFEGFLKKLMDSAARQEMAELIDRYRRGLVPLMAPVTLLQHYLRLYPNSYLQQQAYFSPYPEQLGLRA